ncbi:MAG: hypothetical protein KC561_18320 [Myxococcales bacterium]|nr:hypothetical protein [Myxococcales bacterium]
MRRAPLLGFHSLCLFATFALSVFGCSDETIPDPSGVTGIGDAGGTVTVDGMTVTIPAGALSEAADVAIRSLGALETEGYSAAPEYADADLIAVLEMTPHGLTFDEPVTVSIPLTEGQDDLGELVVLALDGPDDTEWEPVGPLRLENGAVEFEISHFSVYTLAQVQAGQCPCWSGADLEIFRSTATARNHQLIADLNGFAAVVPQGRYFLAEARGTADPATNSCFILGADRSLQVAISIFAAYFPRLA